MSALDDIRQRAEAATEGPWETCAECNACEAKRDRARLLGKLDAVLALCVTSEEHAAQFGDVPSVYVDDIRTAVNDALEADK